VETRFVMLLSLAVCIAACICSFLEHPFAIANVPPLTTSFRFGSCRVHASRSIFRLVSRPTLCLSLIFLKIIHFIFFFFEFCTIFFNQAIILITTTLYFLIKRYILSLMFIWIRSFQKTRLLFLKNCSREVNCFSSIAGCAKLWVKSLGVLSPR
jgi:hypothetical protein